MQLASKLGLLQGPFALGWHVPVQSTAFVVLCWPVVCQHLLDQQASKAAANVSKAHQLVILLTA